MAPPGFRRIDPVGRFPVSMLESLPVILIVGTILGFLAGLGIGGGSLLIIWLTMVLEMEQSTARSINLLFFIPSAIAAIVFRWQQGAIHIQKILPAIIGGCIAAVVFSWLGSKMDLELLKKLFGGLLILTGLRELFYKPKTSGRGK